LEELEAEAVDSGAHIDDDVCIPKGVLRRQLPKPVMDKYAAEVDASADAAVLDICEVSIVKEEMCGVVEQHLEKSFRRMGMDAGGNDVGDMAAARVLCNVNAADVA